MPIPVKVKSLDNVPEAYHDLYKAHEGGFLLDAEASDGWSIADVGGLRSALNKERTKARKGDSILNPLGYTFDPDENGYKPGDDAQDLSKLDEMAGRLKELEALDPEKEADKIVEAKLAGYRKEIDLKSKTQVDEVEAKRQAVIKQLEEQLIDNAVISAIAAHGGDEKLIRIMSPHVKAQMRVREDDEGKFESYVMDGDDPSTPRYSTNADAGGKGLMGALELVGEMKVSDDWEDVWPTEQKGGGGTPPAKGGREDKLPADKAAPRRRAGSGVQTVEQGDYGRVDASLEELAGGEVVVTANRG